MVLIVTAIGWKLGQSVEESALNDKLREDWINAHNLILEPFIILFETDAAWAMENKCRKDKGKIATGKMLSLENRKYAFKLSLVGADSVVIAHNELMQFFYNQDEITAPTKDKLKKMMRLLGAFLLEICRSMGNESIQLTNCKCLSGS